MAGKRTLPDLWPCPKCGRSFANRNQTHTCGLHDLESHFRGKPPKIRALFEEVVRLIQAIGPVRILPEKTRIAFQVRMSFAQLTPRQKWLDGHLVLARRLEHPRFRQVQTFSPRNHLHAFRLTSSAELDSEFGEWMKEAYRVGEQKHLRAVGGLTAQKFREMALRLPGAIESAHMNHPDFRVGGKIFATLSAAEEYGVVMLSPEQQQHFLAAAPEAFSPAAGAWGRHGSTRVHLEDAQRSIVESAIKSAWQLRAPRP